MKIYHGLAIVGIAFSSFVTVYGQASSTASRQLDFSSFYGLTRTNSGVAGNSCDAATLELDSIVASYPAFSISAVVRASSPFISTKVSESNAAGGVKLMRPVGRFRMYSDLLYGRAQLDFLNGGMPVLNSTVVYTQSRSSVVMFGIGASFDLSETLALRFDQQFERLSLPVTATGHGTAMPFTFGLAYHLPYTKHGRPY